MNIILRVNFLNYIFRINFQNYIHILKIYPKTIFDVNDFKIYLKTAFMNYGFTRGYLFVRIFSKQIYSCI